MQEFKLNNLSNNFGAKKNRKRVGRGIGSGKGKTCGRGVKGQKARSGVAIKGFEGGQMPIIKRLPKRGFNCHTSVEYHVISVQEIAALIAAGKIDKIVTKAELHKVGRIKNQNLKVKMVSSPGIIDSGFTVELDAYSVSAKALLERCGGKVL